MDARREIREFLASRRARLTPESVGLPNYGRRRVPGLRREEVAVLAGISVPYYARLERGDMSKASDSVLAALARALRLDDAERAHLFNLARAARPIAARARGTDDATRVRPVVQQLIDAFTGAAAFVNNHRLDILTGNALGYALCAVLFAGARSTNLARFTFLDPGAHEFFADWDSASSDVVADLRAAAGGHPHDRRLAALIGELTAHSEEFRTRWAAHDVNLNRSGIKRVNHPLVGELELNYEQLDLPSDPGLAIFTFSAPPGTPAAESLSFLASWTSAGTL
ncbi:helix-turn-helix domain-containing protein [Dactylosporangium sp. CA-092794]|uniref:helix-turn-helix domain-containing protein n=1 Tax=Dactylosporangium sp. CA-092794 TaxID=3239929 RepID=UPI003D89F388